MNPFEWRSDAAVFRRVMGKWNLVKCLYEIGDNDILSLSYLAKDTVDAWHQ